MIDLIFYVSFKIKGFNVYILQCDKTMELCQVSDYTLFKNNNFKYQSKICNYCTRGFLKDFKNDYFKKIKLSDFKLSKIKYSHKITILKKLNFPVEKFNEIVNSAVIRFNGRTTLNLSSRKVHKIKKLYLLSSLNFLTSFDQILKKFKIEKIISHHGIYSPQGLILEFAKLKKIPCYVWHQAYRKNSISVYKNNNQHAFFSDLLKWKKFNFKNYDKLKIRKYLNSRKSGTNDWVKYQSNEKKILKGNYFKNNNETYLLATNVSWDAQIHFKKNFFKNMEEFIVFTINYFIKHKNKNLIVRCHPGELLSQVPSSSKVSYFIKNRFSALPENIKIIDSFSNVNTLELGRFCDVILVYASKISIEFACQGKPVICCGEAWIKGKNITFDPKNINEYLSILNHSTQFLKNISKNKINEALKFAFYLFYKKTIELESIKKGVFFEKSYTDLSLISQNKMKDVNLEYIINCIINNKDVIK